MHLLVNSAFSQGLAFGPDQSSSCGIQKACPSPVLLLFTGPSASLTTAVLTPIIGLKIEINLHSNPDLDLSSQLDVIVQEIPGNDDFLKKSLAVILT